MGYNTRADSLFLFHYSLSATFLRNRLIAALHSATDPAIRNIALDISQNFVFEHATVQELAAAIESLVDPSSGRQEGAGRTAEVRVEEINALIEKFSIDLPNVKKKHFSQTSDEAVVVLTGATGNIGSHILASLLRDPRVRRVYVLNRPSSVASPSDRIQASFAERGLPVELLAQGRLICLAGDVRNVDFGLSRPIFREVCAYGYNSF